MVSGVFVVEGNMVSGESRLKVELPKIFRKLMGIAPCFLQKIPYVVRAMKTITAYVTTATRRKETSIVVASSMLIVYKYQINSNCR